MRIRLQPVPDGFVQHLTHGAAFYAFDDFAGKGVNQHPPRGLFRDAARAQVKDALVVQLADGRAVRAFHVVGVNFQLGLGVGGRVIGKQQVFVRLLGVGLLRDGVDEDPPVKNALRFVIENAVEIFMAGAMRLGVFDDHVMVGELVATRQVKPVQNTFQPFAREFGADIVA